MIVLLIIQVVFFFTPIGKIMGLEDMNAMNVLISIIMVLVVFGLDELTKPILVNLAHKKKER